MTVVEQIQMILSLSNVIDQGLIKPCGEYIQSFGDDAIVSSLRKVMAMIYSKLVKPANMYKEIQEPPVYMEGVFETLKDIKGSIEDYQFLIDNFENLSPADLQVEVAIKPPSLQEGQGEKVKVEGEKKTGGGDRPAVEGQGNSPEMESTQYFLADVIMSAAEFQVKEVPVFQYKTSHGNNDTQQDYISCYYEMIRILQKYEKFREQNSKGINNLTDALSLFREMERIIADYSDCMTSEDVKKGVVTCADSIYSNLEDEAERIYELEQKSSADKAQKSSAKDQSSATSGEGSESQVKGEEVKIKQPKTQRKLPSPKMTFQHGELYDDDAEKYRQFGTQIMDDSIFIY